MDGLLESALRYASQGWMVFPLHTPEPNGCSCCKPKCTQHGKHPRFCKGLIEHGNKDASNDPSLIRQWWSLWPDANIGIRTGADSGFFMVGPDGDQGIADMASLEADHGEFLPTTPTAFSGGGGSHYLFHHPGGMLIKNSRNHKGTKIDIRGDGGLFVASPSLHKSGKRYSWKVAPSDTSIATAPTWLLEWVQSPNTVTTTKTWSYTSRPYDDNIESRAMALLNKRVGPAISGSGGHDRTFNAACVLVHGYGLSPDEAFPILARWNDTCQPPWTEKELRHKLEDAAKKPGPRGYLLRNDRCATHVDLSRLLTRLDPVQSAVEEPDEPEEPQAPKDFPSDVLKDIPGLIGEVIDHNLTTAMYPQPELALAGALALQAVLSGRKVSDPWNTRTNCYLIGLAHSGAGKEHACKLNDKILMQSGAGSLRGPTGLASGAGLISALQESPAALFQLDELGRMLATMKSPEKAPHLYAVGSVLMKLYSKSDTIFIGDAYADFSRTKTIDQPNAVVYGTSTPDKFWANLTTENVAEGLIGRFMIFEARGYVPMQRKPPGKVPQNILERAAWWFGLQTHGGNLSSHHPEPHVATYTPEAQSRLDDHLFAISEKRMQENIGRASLWSRTGEKTCKLALLFACSHSGHLPIVITLEDVDRAIKLSNYLTRIMIRKVFEHVSENDTEAKVKRILRILDRRMTLTELTRKTQWLRLFERREILTDLVENGLIVRDVVESGTKTITFIQSADAARKLKNTS